MNTIDSKIQALYDYKPDLTKCSDFDQFWAETIEESKRTPLNPLLRKIDYPSRYVTVYDITYCGFDGTPIHGWYLVPNFTSGGKSSCLINYHGFGGSRGTPSGLMHWVLSGMSVISVDCRMQGGDSGNYSNYTSGMVQNFSCLGILNPYEYYYRAVYMDCIRAIDFAETCENVASDKIVIHGISQGGGIGMAVCALDHRPIILLVNVASNSNIERRVENENGSFSSVSEYLRRYPDRITQVYKTISYFDTMNMADQINCKVFASVALKDTTCPAECYFASYNRIRSEKQIEIYPFNRHDGAHEVQIEKELSYLDSLGIL